MFEAQTFLEKITIVKMHKYESIIFDLKNVRVYLNKPKWSQQNYSFILLSYSQTNQA